MGYYVYELCSDDSLPRYVGVGKHGEPSSWLPVWTHRAQWPGPLAAWLRTLDEKPRERILLGNATGLTAKEARAIAAMRIRQVNAYATGREDEQASFLLNDGSFDPSPRGKECALLVDGHVEIFPSVSAAGRACGVARETIGRALRQGRLARGGRRAGSGAPTNI
jgi:hypothetical protein